MPLVRGIRLLNSLETGNVSGACLETIVTCPARAADFVSILQSPGFACLAASSNTSTHAVTRSNTAMNTLAQTTVGACIYYSTPAFANNFAYSGPAFDNLLTSNDSFKHFSNSALTMNCSFATGTQFITCAAGSNTNLARMFTCPITACCIFASSAAMASLAGNANIVSYLFNDPTAAACFSTYGGATAVCNAFGGTAYIDYILQPGKTCSAFACSAIGPYAFTNPLSANCFIKNACALCVLVNLPACCALGTSCTFTCFAASTYGIPCATTEYLAGNTSFITQVFALNSCAQLGALVYNNSFISCYYKATTPFNNKFNCFWNNQCNTTCGGRACCPARTDLTGTAFWTPTCVGSTFGVRTPCFESILSSVESAYYMCAWCEMSGAHSTSNNGSFLLLSGGYQVSGSAQTPLCYCFDGVNYCSTLSGAGDHTALKTSGFCVVCPAMLYSNTNGCTWTRLPGFCIPSTAFTSLCCDGFSYNACTAGQCGRVEIQWGLGSFTCGTTADGYGIWQGWRINNLCCQSHAIFGYACTCVLANNTPGAWTVCVGKPHPFTLLTFCCGFFSGIGGDCVTTNFTVASINNGRQGCYCNAPSACYHLGYMLPRFIIGKMTGGADSCAFQLNKCVSCCCNCLSCYGINMWICGTGLVNGCREVACECPMSNPFYCMTQGFVSCGISCDNNPALSFMTCVWGCTTNIRAWMMQLDRYESRAGYYGENIATHASCTLLEWNAGSPRKCDLSGGGSGIGLYCHPLGGAVPIGNTILFFSTPFVQSYDAGGSYPFHTYACTCCYICEMGSVCSNFAWGSDAQACPDGYPQTGKGLRSSTCVCGAYMPYMAGGSACGDGARLGYVTRFSPVSNSFVTIMPCVSGCGICGASIRFNYPNQALCALEIYGNKLCMSCCSGDLQHCQDYCNIGFGRTGNCSDVSPFGSGTSPRGVAVCRIRMRCSGNIPGCTMPAFCDSFMLVEGVATGMCGARLVGWPCPLVYSGSCCWPWGSVACVNCSGQGHPECQWALGCNPNAGRCGYTGASYGWTETCPQGCFFCVNAFGCGCCAGFPCLVCTANGMPSIAAATIICGSGFYANGQTYTTCAFKLRYVDMF